MKINSRILKIYIDSDNVYCCGCEYFEYAEFDYDSAYCRLFGKLEKKDYFIRHSNCLKSECFYFN